MKSSHTAAKLVIIIVFVATFFLVASRRSVNTYPLFVGKAKQLGYPAQDCTYCHTQQSGGIGHNERGRWLIAEKTRRLANAVDVAWLSDYKPAAGGKVKSKARRRS